MKKEIDVLDFKEAIIFLKNDAILGSYIKSISVPKYSIETDYFSSLCKYIIYQQLSVQSAAKTHARFLMLFDSLNPIRLLKTDEEILKQTGLSYRKIEYLKELSKSFINNDNFQKFSKKTNDQIIQILTSVKGIGSWTAEMFLIFTMQRMDVFSSKDIGLLNALKIVFDLDSRPSFLDAELLSERWMPYRTIASLYLWKIIEGEDFDW
ncbi:MAG: hypothetical protein CMP66_05360 [Flavobacteriales bacterium]|nr:hypothetical protein [Flavobacteriales bacterium]|tara:strand:- start:38 stop:661 length:624 start_codon:yes stop_codon:yes gene_type:complete